ncbi:MAG: 50S ribosome-binding GTPase [Demequinaceae bacterium]|nr:50S ribosome-binding GTPase [Demequinaceae bacterium]
MSVSFTHLDPPSETTFLLERVARLRASLEWAGDAISPRLRVKVSKAVARIDERLRLGVDSTIVALAGGTGSGKSSLFNAISRTDFAIVGVSRPTTAHVSAVTWDGRADALLDWLGVDPERRFSSGDALDANEAAALKGLILLDLPDHDSVDAAHKQIVDRVVPMADLVAWVVDPQKYADNALHSQYLADIAAVGAPSAVILNQIDRLSRGDADAVMFDIRRLLAEKGIENAPVLLTSVVTGAGIDSLRSVLASVVKKRSVAAEAVRSDLVATGRDLAKALAKGAEPAIPSVDALVDDLLRAAGIPVFAEAVDAVALGKGSSAIRGRLTAAAVEAIRTGWIEAATDGLPRPWRKVLNGAIPRSRVLAETVSAALDAVEWPEVAPPKSRFRKPKASDLGERCLALGRVAVGAAITPDVVEPTEMMHQAYRAMDELTDLAIGEDPENEAAAESP